MDHTRNGRQSYGGYDDAENQDPFMAQIADKKQRQQKENNRKRIKNLRRRVYDSLNVFLACNIFSKERKKVTFNPDFYEYLPDEFRQSLYGEVSAAAALKAAKSPKLRDAIANAHSEKSDADEGDDKDARSHDDKSQRSQLEKDDEVVRNEVSDCSERIKYKMQMLHEMVE